MSGSEAEVILKVEGVTPLKDFLDFLRERLGAELGDKLVAIPGTSTGIGRWDISAGEEHLGVLWAYGKPNALTTIEYQGRLDPNSQKVQLMYSPDYKNGEMVPDSWQRRDEHTDIPFP